jgi:uncharacterized FlaG/YvyC family protein
MDNEEQIDQFQKKLDKLVNTYSEEFDLSIAAMIGVFVCKIYELLANQENEEDEEDELV